MAFAAGDFDTAVAKLALFHRVVTKKEDAVMFGAGGLRVEIVRDTALEDLFWCPMRPSGLSALRLTVRDPQTNARVTDFATIHEKTLHLFIVSRDLAYFAHVHPEPQEDGTFLLRHEISAGECDGWRDPFFARPRAAGPTNRRAKTMPSLWITVDECSYLTTGARGTGVIDGVNSTPVYCISSHV